jgi:hypothetical protein
MKKKMMMKPMTLLFIFIIITNDRISNGPTNTSEYFKYLK